MVFPAKRVPYTFWIWTALGCAGAFAAYRVHTLRWVCDDAFISFRYAKNLASGLGLVFNAGERVEGYTNFLWTLIAAAGLRLHLDPVLLTMILGAGCYFGTAGVLLYLSLKTRRQDPSWASLPLAALCWLVLRDAHVYATSGLETASVTLLVTAVFATLTLAARLRHYTWAGVLLTLALLSRPDSVVFAAVAVVFVLLQRREALKHLAAMLLPVILVYVPYWLWRFDYYGFPFPNTYYAKSAYLSNWSQGLLYIRLFFDSYYGLYFLVPALPYLLWRLWPGNPARFQSAHRRAALLAVLFILGYLLYVARVGGDFMFARFLIPISPIILFAIEMAWRPLVRANRHVAMVALVLPALLLMRWDAFDGVRYRYGVADESRVYPLAWYRTSKLAGTALNRCLGGLPIRVAAPGERMAWAYYSNVPVVIEIAGGLTDTTLAHRMIVRRGRPGHEKGATPEFLEQRGYHILLSAPFYDEKPIDSLRQFRIFGIDLRLITYDRQIMDELRHNDDVHFICLPTHIDSLLAERGESPAELWQERYLFFKRFYFDHNDDSTREEALKAKL